MRKFVLTFAIALCTLVVHSADFAYLAFVGTGGTVTVFSLNGLTFNISASELHVIDNHNNVAFVLSDLAFMQFTNDSTGESIDTEMSISDVIMGNDPITVYTITGTRMGQFETLLQAVKNLLPGTYVVSNGTTSQKIIVK